VSVKMRLRSETSDRHEKAVQVIRCAYPDCGYEMHPELHSEIVETWAGYGLRDRTADAESN
jgi:hypothetical protein